jgi:hypothetical protein
LLCAISTGPHGELSIPIWGPKATGDPTDICRPIGVEVHAVNPDLLARWQSPAISTYNGMHGLKI